MERIAMLACLVVAACDGGTTVSLTLDVRPSGENSGLSATIDGVPSPVTRELSWSETLDLRVEIVVWYEGDAVGTYDEQAHHGCLGTGDLDLDHVDASTSWCIAGGGDLRSGSESDDYGNGHCVSDAFCWPRCSTRNGCADGRRCSSAWLHEELSTAALMCVPVGPKSEGDACSYGPPGPETGHDDCGAGLICVDATCRPFCSDVDPCSVGSCEALAGHESGIRACVP